MTDAQKRSVWELQDWLNAHAGDSNGDNTNSPRGDGRWVNLLEVWGRGNRSTAHRRNIGLAWQSGELAAYEIAHVCGMVKLCQCEQVDTVEQDFYFNDPSLSESVRQARQQVGFPKRKVG